MKCAQISYKKCSVEVDGFVIEASTKNLPTVYIKEPYSTACPRNVLSMSADIAYKLARQILEVVKEIK